jgi:hypothetical protein
MDMIGFARVSDVEVIAERTLRVVFTDGLVREIDFTGVLSGVLAELDSDEVFAAVDVDPVAGTLSWPGGIDMDPDVLHGDEPAASPAAPRLVREYRVERTT